MWSTRPGAAPAGSSGLEGFGRAGRARTGLAVGTAALLALAVAGCGLLGSSGSEGDAAAAQSSTPAAAASTATSGTQPTTAALRAADYILTTNSGFTGFTPSSSTAGGSQGASPLTELASCLGAAATAGTATDEAESTHLVNATTGVTIWSDAQVVSAGQVEQDTNLLRDPNFTTCAAAQAKQDGIAALTATGQGSVLSPEADPRDTTLPAGALARSSTVVLAGLSSGGQAQIFYDTIYLGSGQVEAQLHLIGTNDPPSEDLISVAVRQLTSKLGQ